MCEAQLEHLAMAWTWVHMRVSAYRYLGPEIV